MREDVESQRVFENIWLNQRSFFVFAFDLCRGILCAIVGGYKREIKEQKQALWLTAKRLFHARFGIREPGEES
jgi:hypothetical protein